MNTITRWLKMPIKINLNKDGNNLCPSCYGKGYLSDSIQLYICDFCKGHKEIDWIDMTTGGTNKQYVPVEIDIIEYDKILDIAIIMYVANVFVFDFNPVAAVLSIAYVIANLLFRRKKTTLKTIDMNILKGK